MERLIICKTDHGRYSVRPIDWEGIWDKYGRIQENGLNHTAIFSEKEDAEFFVKAKEAEEKGKMLILPCNPEDKVYALRKSWDGWKVYGKKFTYAMIPKIGKTVFLTEQEAKKALEVFKI